MHTLEPAVSPVVDVVVTGLILLWRLSKPLGLSSFLCGKGRKIACVCDKLIELTRLIFGGVCGQTLERLIILVVIWSLRYSVVLKQALSTPPQ